MTKLIAITGGSGSGKTTVAQALARRLAPARVALIGEDDYYRCRTSYPNFDEARHNFDEPAAKDDALLAAHLAAAKRGEAFQKPLYDLKTHTRQRETETIIAADAIIVEGIHVLATPVLRALFDLAVFLDADESLRLGRRMIRDVRDRARTPKSVLTQFFEHVRPMHALHIAPQAAFADLVLMSTYEGGLAEADAQAETIARLL